MSCPICGKDTEAKYRPFCSKRCADIDLGRWLTGSYVIPGDAVEDEESPRPGDGPGRPENLH
ncbi:DNA gyrase inhibitor YacG [Frigidibacter sp. MR17.14]|uniref:DNA gyrase inhibitor YacG n=1 Tax=Frigidibacter sp. MR17.14 TaxID=3126509 RepID=UPI003012D71A